MAQTSVAQFAGELRVPPSVLLEQLRAAGVHKQVAEDVLSEQDKTRLLEYLRKSHGSSEPKNKITLTRKQTTEIIKKSDASGKARTIQVEVKKKRIFVKRDAEPGAPAEVPGLSGGAVDSREAELREEEQRRNEELAARQAADLAEKQERERKLAEGKPSEVKTQAPAPASDTTLHKPKVAPGAEKKGAKKAKEIKVWKDEGVKRRTIKTRGDVQGASGWHNPKGRHKAAVAPVAEGVQQFSAPAEPVVREVMVPETITVGDLAHKMSVKAAEVIKALMKLGSMATINQVLDQETAMIIVTEMGHVARAAKLDDPESLLAEVPDEHHEAELKARAPVVTVMGHVDHGKTSLLDYIRRTKVASGEAGGITQHIGAYHVQTPRGMVTFLDTPGHEAFTAMRARGAKVTDIVVLVVAADDGVMPQTAEAINHARAASVPIIVAINKIDKPEANIEKIKQGLMDYGLVAEDSGGDTICVPVSAKSKEGIPQLLEMLLLQAEVLELKANLSKLARGTIVEAKLDRGRGPVATVLVQEGTLRVGDAFVCGVFYGKVRAMVDDRGNKVDAAPPSFPVEILGLQGVPQAGDSFVAVADEAKARQVAEYRHSKQRETELVKSSKVSLEELYDQIKAGDMRELRVVLKADVQGSVEALTEALGRLSSDEVKLRVLHGSVGGITESDILLAAASNAIVMGFNVRPESKGAALAAKEGVDVRLYTIIYEAVADVRAAMEGMLEPVYREQTHGHVEIRQTFNIQGIGTIAGCYVSEGKIQR